MSQQGPIQAHLPPSPDAAEGRRHPRRSLYLETSGSLPGGASANVTVHNISAAGLLLQTELSLDVGEVLSIDLPELGPVGAEIVWQSGELYGCAFEQALGEAALAAAQLRGGFGAGTPAQPQPAPTPAVSFDPGVGSGFGQSGLGKRLNTLRRERGLTLAQVADALGVSKPTVWAWEKDKARPLPERIGAIADVLGVTSEDLMEVAGRTPAGALIEECRQKIAAQFGADPSSVRISIEL
ncbi:hypothetical protein NAP1_11628 [Erythrobacter sp. NAP1]|uniref:helix-turn-helix domain-containing protein n=1 Tax=Erythrobacter sp. NAP1 TaxID=237727 RepID=UPI00006879D8|nr:helix-turn-helix domain-containing protein [Erythrobacter sp. NAP1]EAQ28243.1 hypothetical protein NAP1_11628 [Erythrobacter sp. NAP1]